MKSTKLINLIKIFVFTFLIHLASASNDPFSMLGIPSLNPSQIFNYESSQKFSKSKPIKVVAPLKNMDDLPRFLQQSKLSLEEGIQIISKFLISDDFILKKFGAVFDQTGFDGLMNLEMVLPKGNKGRDAQRAKSAAKLFYKNSINDSNFDAYGAEKIEIGNLPQGWEVYKILLIRKGVENQHIFLKVCLPLDEMLVPLVTNFNLDCIDKVRNFRIFIKNKSILIF
jgi:hypothetical protein